MNAARLFASLGFVFAGLLGRALLDKLLAAQGGTVAVAGWAQLSSLADLVAGVSLTGIGPALTVLAAGEAPERRLTWLKPALLVCLGLSLAAALLCLPLALSLPASLAPGEAALPPLALLSGWLAIAGGLLVSWWLGTGEPRRATALILLGFAPPVALLLWAPAGTALLNALAGQAAFGLAATVGLALALRRQPAASRQALATLLHFVPAGLAIGILSPAATAWARVEIAGSLSWHEAGQVQALWRASDWITAVMSGLLHAYFLPRLGAAADGRAFAAEMRRTALAVVLPAALLLAALWLLLPQALALLYRADIGIGRGDALFFLLGDWVRVMSWVALYGLFARRSAWAIAIGEFLSVPLFALLLTLLAGRYDLRQIGLIWLATYLAYAAFNGTALWRSLRRMR